MTKTLYRGFALLVLLLIVAGPLTAAAEESQIYTIKKGDTLWDISKRFIDDPYYWPNVWANNPVITNPHLIFPGQKIRIIDGRLEIIPAYGEGDSAPQVIDNGQPVEITSAGQITVKGNGSGDGFILTSETPLGLVVDSVDNRVLLTEDDLIFVKMNDLTNVSIGDTYGIFERGDLVKHPQTNESLGTMMHNLGYLQVTGFTGNTVTAKITKAYREVERGAELFEYVPLRKEIIMTKSAASAPGVIIANRDEKDTLATGDVIFINLGSAEGASSGNLFYISRPRQVSDELVKQAGPIELPEEVLGAAVVIDSQEHSSSAIIFKSVNAAFVGDTVTMAAE